ncbi:MAG: sigma-E factor negative regulatory protein [Burkholderiales bacterium]|nr:sigma-E factor negative regulatory protein [Burkholderiales bacterium]
MNEKISRLMDGELDAAEFDACCAQLGSAEARATWRCYHVIGDHLRGTGVAAGGGDAFLSRLHTALAAEPTVLAPQRVRTATPPATFAWAIAATLAAVTVVGWTAMSMVDVPPNGMAKARDVATVRAGAIRSPAADLPNEYLLAHQEYSPLALQGGAPYLRSAAMTAPAPVEPRP